MVYHLAEVTFVSTLQLNWGLSCSLSNLFVVELMKYCHYIMFGYNLLVNSYVASSKFVIVFLLSNLNTSHLVYLSAGPYCEPSDGDTPQVY